MLLWRSCHYQAMFHVGGTFMTRRRSGFWLLAILVLVAGGLAARQFWHDWRLDNGIDRWHGQGVDIAWSGLEVDQFSVALVQPGRQIEVQGRGLSLRWSWTGLQLDTLAVEQLTLDWQARPDTALPTAMKTSSTNLFSALPATAPFWLPRQLNIAGFSAELPCASGRCQLAGALVMSSRQSLFPLATELTLRASVPELAVAGVLLRGLHADLKLTGQMNADTLALDFADASVLQLEQLDKSGSAPAMGLDGLHADVHNLQLTAVFDPVRKTLVSAGLKGPLALTVQKVRHSDLHPQSWQFGGELDCDLAQLGLAGLLSAKAGAEVKVGVKYPFGGTLEARAQLQVSGSNGSRALAATLTAWPALLTFETGKLNAVANVRLPAGSGPALRGQLAFSELSGIYDRVAWSGLSGTVALDLEKSRLNFRFPDLVLGQLNPGIPVGPINVTGSYDAASAQVAAGRLELKKGTAGFAGGQVRVDPAVWTLANQPQRLLVHLNEVQLSRLMELYPAKGLAGTGSLSGQVPVMVGPDGISVKNGQLAALPPGGTLRIPLERLSALGQGNPAMQQVVMALQNFHYDVLGSTVDYDQDGTLTLGLHMEGRNPDFRDGQPFNFNIGLQEDIPALLTSLQLGGRVSDAVTERVKKRFSGKNAKGAKQD